MKYPFLILAVSLLALGACNRATTTDTPPDGSAGTTGTAGTTGAAGDTGTAGTTGVGGTGGTDPTGTAGTGGSDPTGTAGTGGSDPTGSAGTTGAGGSDSSGSAGTTGSGGSTDTGTAGTTGAGGSSDTSGTGGTTGSAGDSGNPGTGGTDSTGTAGTTGTGGSDSTGAAGTTGTGSGGSSGGGSTGSGGTGGSTEPPVCGPIVTADVCVPRTQGYWKQHAGSFAGSLKLGNVCYTDVQLQSIFDMMVVGNGLDELAHQLIAAKLNIAAGAVADASVLQAIADADARIGDLVVPPVGTDSLPSSADDAQIAALVSALNAFNQDGAACK